MAGTSKGAVLGAMVGNGALCVIKLGAFAVSGSGAIFSEAIHSIADTANQGLLYLGIRQSERPADHLFHYGYGADRYLYSLLSAVGIFVLGCGVTMYHGIHDLLQPPALKVSWIPIAVLLVSLVVEGAVLVAATRVVWAHKGGQSLWSWLRTTSDPTAAAVMLEDSVACLGVLVALGCIGMAHVTGNAAWDAVGAIAIGAMLGFVAIWLGIRNRTLLLGPAMPADLQREIEAYLRQHPAIMRVHKARSRLVGANRFRFKAELDFDGRVLGRRLSALVHERWSAIASEADRDRLSEDFGERLLDELGREVDQIEAELAARFPQLEYVDLEAD